MKLLRLFLMFFALFLTPHAAEAAAKFLVLCTTACTWDNTNDTIWSTSSGGTNNTTHPVAGDTVTLDASSCVGGLACTITGGAVTLSMSTLTIGACTAATTGCTLDFSANNTNLTISSTFSLTGTGTRVFNCGTGTISLAGTIGTVWDITTKTNLTLSCASATIDMTTTGTQTGTKTFTGSTAMTYGTVKAGFTVGTGGFQTTINAGSSTITTMNIDGFCNCRFQGGLTTTITNAFTWNSGGSASQIFALQSATAGSAATISVASGTSTINWATLINNMAFTGGGTFACNNCMSQLQAGNSGITVTGPGGSSGRIIGGYLLKRDLPYWANDRGVILKKSVKPDNDNRPLFLNKAS